MAEGEGGSGSPLRTPLCDQLGMRYPVVQAPMAGGWTTPALVAAVVRSGGLGFLAAALATVDALEEWIRAVRAETDGVFGVNFLLAPPEPAPSDVDAVQDVLDPLRAELGLPPGPRELHLPPNVLEEQLEAALGAGVPVISFAMGNPGTLVDRVHASGARALVMVTSVEEATAAESAGADAVIAQGVEAGGHRSTFHVGEDRDLPEVGTLALVPQVVDAVSVPVIAAGGIMDGRGIVAALALGAQAAQLGTRFLLARESGAFPAYRQWITAGTETSSRVTRLLTGRAARAIGNPLLRLLEEAGVGALPWPYQALAAQDLYRHSAQHGLAESTLLLAGQGLRMSGRETGAGEIVDELVRQAARVLEELGAHRGGSTEARSP